jgi:hypothetical protein
MECSVLLFANINTSFYYLCSTPKGSLRRRIAQEDDWYGNFCIMGILSLRNILSKQFYCFRLLEAMQCKYRSCSVQRDRVTALTGVPAKACLPD